ncbi:MAG TPA: hypothetical protein DDW49_07930 [Deltaproteobacteria bacterium]|nr:MAG: hypothetical protein A2048_07260 [Deltaproteobacteria bacterium GWA2_45_12]HBF13292.1 hypothetical protein [Deltaproteobacteria bacterium]
MQLKSRQPTIFSKKSHYLFFIVIFLLIGLGTSSFVFGKEKEHSFWGSLTQRYKLRSTGAVSDHDSESIVNLNLGHGNYDRFSASVQAGLIVDINGAEDNKLFSSIYDSYSSRAVGRLYHAYFDARKVGPIGLARLGRQHIYEIDSVYFDGASVTTRPYYGLVFSAFGGVPVHLYESQIGVGKKDWTLGGSVQWTPLARLRLRGDVVHLKDDTSSFRITQQDQEDTLLSGSVWADLTKIWNVFGRVSAFSDEMRDVEAASTLRFDPQKLSFRFRVYRLLEDYDIRVVDWDAYGIAGSYRPYTEGGLNVTKEMSKYFSVDGGFVVRRLDDRQIASAFNHGFERVFTSLSSRDFLVKGLSTSTTFDYYHSRDNVLKNNTSGVSFSANQDLLKKRLKVGAGTAFYLYRYNLLTGNESDNVRTYFTNAEAILTKKKDLKAKMAYEIEDNKFNTFHSLKAGVTWNF